MNERTDAHAHGPIFHRGNENEISLNSHYHIRLFRSIVDGMVSEICAFCMTLVLCHATHTLYVSLEFTTVSEHLFARKREGMEKHTHARRLKGKIEIESLSPSQI